MEPTAETPRVVLTQDECDAIGVDGRDGRGDIAESDLSAGEAAALAAYREVRSLLDRLPIHEFDVLRDGLIELAQGTRTDKDWDRDVAWAREALKPDADERARRQAEYDDANGDPLPEIGSDY